MDAEDYTSLLRRQRNCCRRCSDRGSWDIYEIFMGFASGTPSGTTFGIATASSALNPISAVNTAMLTPSAGRLLPAPETLSSVPRHRTGEGA